jgi:predicted small metal-binding protein
MSGTSPEIRQNGRVEPADLYVRCVCGWEVRGAEEIVVPATQEHGRRLHNMAASRDEVLAMATREAPETLAEPAPRIPEES